MHGCADELEALLHALGYRISWKTGGVDVQTPESRLAVFLGDLVDRGPRSADVLRIAKGMHQSGQALVVVGNHDDKLMRYLAGRDVKIAHGLADTIRQLEREPQEFSDEVRAWIAGLPSHLLLDCGKLVVVHAGLKEDMHGKESPSIRRFCMYGETTGELDQFGLPVRWDWAVGYQGQAKVVYGHAPVREPVWVNRTICIDTGCVFGGSLTALRYPELELVSVQARQVYFEPSRRSG